MKFGSKYVFNVLFILTGAVCLWVGALFTSKLIMYTRFSHHTVGTSQHWGVISLEEEKHRICVDYNFTVDGKLYTAQHMFLRPTYSNKDAAEYAIEVKKSDEVSVWYMKRGKGKTPLSIVDRKFPHNEMYRLIIALATFGYFFFLKRYLYHYREGVAVDEHPSKSNKATT